MGYVRVRDDVIWATNIEGDDALRKRVKDLPSGVSIELEIDGIVGQWEKMKSGKDGRTTNGVKPVGPMRDVWKRFQTRRGRALPIRETRTADSYLAAVSGLLADEWNSPEDEEAFSDL